MRNLLFALALSLSAVAANAAELTRDAIETADFTDEAALSAAERSPLVVKVQVLLDRANISPGIVDGYFGENVANALSTFEKKQGLEPDGELDEEAWKKLREGTETILTEYEITEDDVNGPFVDSIPEDWREKAEMERLAYTGPEELLAEKFHMSRELLEELNPDADFSKAGTRIVVAAVREPKPEGKVLRIEVDKAVGQVRGYDGEDRLIVAYPATIGSEENPSPSGTMPVKAIAPDPVYYYRPDENFQIGDIDEPLEIPPGPNNPVGSVWIDLDKEGYGIHGTPDPAHINKTTSHGCVRLTNWDAEQLADLVEEGSTTVEFLGG